jgi:hypothetical protein
MRLLVTTALRAAVLLASATAAHAQTYRVKQCDAPREPLGVLHAQGQVAFRLASDGKPDSGSIRVVSLRGISPGGLRSAAVRELSACRFDRSADTGQARTNVIVVDAVGFDSATVVVSPATVVAPTIVTMPIPRSPLVIDPVDATDSTVEERPRRLSCNQVPDQPPFAGSYRTRQEADAALAAWRRENSGVLLARITVPPEGDVRRDGITVTSSTNPAIIDDLIRVLMSCRFVPGRINGVPVPTIVATRTAIGIAARP